MLIQFTVGAKQAPKRQPKQAQDSAWSFEQKLQWCALEYPGMLRIFEQTIDRLKEKHGTKSRIEGWTPNG